MDKVLAEKTASVAMQSSFVLDSYLIYLKQQLEAEEFSEVCQKFGKAMSETYFQILEPIWAQYPELLPEKMGGTYKTKEEHYLKISKLALEQANE